MLTILEAFAIGVASLVTLSTPIARPQTWGPDSERARDAASQLTPDVFGDFTAPDMSLREALNQALSGPPNPGRIEVEGGVIFSGCRLHSCDEKGAVFFDSYGTPLAAALLHLNCSDGRRRATGIPCLRVPMVTIVQSAVAGAGAKDRLIEWARSKQSDLTTIEVIMH